MAFEFAGDVADFLRSTPPNGFTADELTACSHGLIAFGHPARRESPGQAISISEVMWKR